MAAHIVLMNAIGPAVAAALVHFTAGRKIAPSGLAAPTLIQMALLWSWHAPPMLEAGSGSWHWFMSGSLLLAAIWYWRTVFRLERARRWRAIASLLITSKLFCLLGILYVFAPRVLFPGMALHHGASGSGGLTDQQLAGLLMLIACPATYILAGVWIAARWLSDLDQPNHRPALTRPRTGAAPRAS